jgi:hypothetical protein
MIQTLRANLGTLSPEPLIDSWEQLKASRIGYRLARGASWSLMGTVASRTACLLP